MLGGLALMIMLMMLLIQTVYVYSILRYGGGLLVLEEMYVREPEVWSFCLVILAKLAVGVKLAL